MTGEVDSLLEKESFILVFETKTDCPQISTRPGFSLMHTGIPALIRRSVQAALVLSLFLLISGCGEKQALVHRQPVQAGAGQLQALGFTIQVGAFAEPANALRMNERLEAFGLEPYYFRHSSGLYKVRFGNYATRRAAASQARQLKSSGYFSAYYIVSPTEHPVSASDYSETLRQQLVATAQGFLGLPYRWGGTGAGEGFDCSGLTMAVYRLNGLNLPRTSREQFQVGRPVRPRDVNTGDLVFFETGGSRRVSHVGVYTGDGRFIHAPGPGKTVRSSSLSGSYYRSRFSGARTYIP